MKPVEARLTQMMVRSGDDVGVKALEERVATLEWQVVVLQRALQARRPDLTHVPLKPQQPQ